MWQGRIVIPQTLQKTTLNFLHRGHPGISAMRALARFYIWWPTLEEDIDNYVKKCQHCQENRPNNSELPVYQWSIPDNVWERSHVDFAGPFEGQYWLVISDALSKWPEIKLMSKITTDKLCDKLEDLFTTFGFPKIIVSDNGPQFTAQDFKEFCKSRGILHITSSPYHPRTNGLAERMVRTFKTRMATSKHDKLTWNQRLKNFLFTYRNTPHSTTGKSPAQMMFGRQLNCILDNARPNTKKTLEYKQFQANIDNDQNIQNYNPGDKIYIKTKDEKCWKPATVTERTHKYSYRERTPDGVEKRRHADHIRPRIAENIDPAIESLKSPSSPTINLPSETIQETASRERNPTAIPSTSFSARESPEIVAPSTSLCTHETPVDSPIPQRDNAAMSDIQHPNISTNLIIVGAVSDLHVD